MAPLFFFNQEIEMPFPTYAVSTELDAVNQILSSVGQAPVTTLDLQNPEVAIVLNTLREVNKQVQAEGWVFNTERHYELTPDSVTKVILYPTNVLQIDTNTSQHFDDYNVVRRGGKLYDKQNHTYQFEEPIYADMVWYFDFTDVPPAIQAYITARAARMCATKMIGDQEINKLLAEQELQTRAYALEYECNQGDYTMFGFRDGQNYYTSYQPFQALAR
jgi:hypothetical protein